MFLTSASSFTVHGESLIHTQLSILLALTIYTHGGHWTLLLRSSPLPPPPPPPPPISFLTGWSVQGSPPFSLIPDQCVFLTSASSFTVHGESLIHTQLSILLDLTIYTHGGHWTLLLRSSPPPPPPPPAISFLTGWSVQGSPPFSLIPDQYVFLTSASSFTVHGESLIHTQLSILLDLTRYTHGGHWTLLLRSSPPHLIPDRLVCAGISPSVSSS